jgi:hypothetical protein
MFRRLGGGYLMASGSGAEQFFDHITVSGGDQFGDFAYPSGLIAKIVAHTLYEWSGDTWTLDQLYGGWFELARKSNDDFHKIPYAIKLWKRSDGIMESGGPVFFGFYAEQQLVVLRLQPREVEGRVVHEQRSEIVPDPLGRGSGSGRPRDVVRPDFVAHFILDQSNWHISYIERSDACDDAMVLEVGPTECRVAYPEGLRKRLLAQQRDQTDFSIMAKSPRG